MQQISCRIVENDYTTNDLLPWMEVQKTNKNDIVKIINVLLKGLKIETQKETFKQLLYTNADLNNSVKLIDKRTNEIYGLLIFSHYSIVQGSPLYAYSPNLYNILSQYKLLNGFAFVIDERLRGKGFDKKMLQYNQAFYENFDFIWCAVETNLKTHNYWKRLGFSEILSIPQAKFYLKLINKNILADIYYKIHNYQQ